MSFNWGYCSDNGPECWSKHFPNSGGQHQSPINISPVNLKNLNKKLSWKYLPDCCEDIINTGYGWKVHVKHDGTNLSGGPLLNGYKLIQFHCHWGQSDDEGSEHTIDGKKFAGELHLVHWNAEKYPTQSEAVQHPDGYAVLGVFFKVGKKNDELEKLVKLLAKIEYKDQKEDIHFPLDPSRFLSENSGYYTYKGSLTTPPCAECVIWILLKEPMEVSSEQLEAFRKLKSHPNEQSQECKECNGYVKRNYRPPSSIGTREIYESR